MPARQRAANTPLTTCQVNTASACAVQFRIVDSFVSFSVAMPLFNNAILQQKHAARKNFKPNSLPIPYALQAARGRQQPRLEALKLLLEKRRAGKTSAKYATNCAIHRLDHLWQLRAHTRVHSNNSSNSNMKC